MGSLEVARAFLDALFQLFMSPRQRLFNPLALGNVIADRQEAGFLSERDQVRLDEKLSQLPIFHPRRHFKISDRPFRFQSIDEPGPIMRIRPDA